MKEVVRFRKSVMLGIKLLLIFAVTLGFMEFWNNFYINTLFSLRGNFVVIFSYVLIFVVFSSLYGAFNIGIYRIHEIIYSFSLAVLFTDAIMYLELSLIARELIAVLPMLGCIAYQIVIIAACCYCANLCYFKLYAARKTLAIFSDTVDGFSLISKMGRISQRFQITQGINADRTDIDKIMHYIDRCEAVVLCDIEKNKQREILAYCYTKQKRAYILPDITDIIINNSHEIQISDTPVFLCRNSGLTVEQEILKRIMDIVISFTGIVISLPIMLLCALAIKLDDGGPVFFTQNRITKNGKIFNILKFRSMTVDADKDGAKKATVGDNRITRVGKIIRACRVDELPQLFNVLIGDMSMVGPRPERIENVYEYSAAHPEFELRHRVKAGLTGFAQLYGKYNTTPLDKLNMDLIYIETYSILQDIKLMVLTFKVLFMKESTEGFDESANKDVRASKSARKKGE